MDITNKTVTELKALAFDELGKVEVGKNNLNIIYTQIKKIEDEEKQKATEAKTE